MQIVSQPRCALQTSRIRRIDCKRLGGAIRNINCRRRQQQREEMQMTGPTRMDSERELCSHLCEYVGIFFCSVLPTVGFQARLNNDYPVRNNERETQSRARCFRVGSIEA